MTGSKSGTTGSGAGMAGSESLHRVMPRLPRYPAVGFRTAATLVADLPLRNNWYRSRSGMTGSKSGTTVSGVGLARSENLIP